MNWIDQIDINELTKQENIKVIEVPVEYGVNYTQERVNKLFKNFLGNLERKNSWGKNELKTMFLETMLEIYDGN